MSLPVHLLIPLASAIVYVFAAMALKRAAVLGVGVWRTAFVANWTMFLVFVPWWLWKGGQFFPTTEYWKPAITGVCFLGGQMLIFLALSRGDVTVTTPVMGFKVILVALASSLLRVGEVPLKWWIGAGLSAAAVILLHGGEHRERRRNVGITVLLATGSAVSYSFNDVLIQKWGPVWGSGNFLPPMFLFVALCSLLFLPYFHAPLRAMPGPAARWVALGAALMAAANAGIVITLGVWGDATAVNIVFSARGLFSVLVVWFAGHWFLSEEQNLGGRVLRMRLAGAGLMVGAILLVLV